MDTDGNCKECSIKCDYTYHQHYDFIKEIVYYDQQVDEIQYRLQKKTIGNMVRLKEQLDRGIKDEKEVLQRLQIELKFLELDLNMQYRIVCHLNN